ncbi:hypothetical protein JHK84_040561 [Glycine max]|nr:hypothetical protein JHK84_040561 [Glycine max]
MDHPKDPNRRKRKVQSSIMSARNQGISSWNVLTLKSQRIRRRNSSTDVSTSKVEPTLDTSLDDEDSQPKDTVNSDAEEEYDGSSGISIS